MSRVAPLPQTDPALDADAAPVSPPVVRGRGALRVAFCIDNMNVGGTELNALRTARHLQERGVDLRVFCLSRGGPLLARYAELGIPVDALPLTRLYGATAVRCGQKLSAAIREHRIDVVHAHDFYSNIFAAPWTRWAGTAFMASRRWWEGPERRLQRVANRASYSLAHRVLANSESVADLLIGKERVSPSKVIVIRNFLDREAFDAPPPGWKERLRSELAIPEGHLVVGVVASLSPIKDHASLFRAFARIVPRMPHLALVVVGADNGSRTSLGQLSRDLGVEAHVRFAGARPTVPSLHHLFDVSALTSVSEGLPNSILEAMAAGRPLLATSVGAVADAVVHGETGFLVPPGDVAGLRASLDTLLQDAEVRARFGAAGLERARSQYEAGKAIDALMVAYQILVPLHR